MKNTKISNATWPATLLFVITFIVQMVEGTNVISSLVVCMITEAFAYLTCNYAVIKKGKGIRAIWINYLLWLFFMNIGVVAGWLGWET